jgi:hypothetical protein
LVSENQLAMGEDIRFVLMVACAVVAVPSGLALVWCHLTLQGAGGLDDDGNPIRIAAEGKELAPYVRGRNVSGLVFGVTSTVAWVSYADPSFVLGLLHVLFKT